MITSEIGKIALLTKIHFFDFYRKKYFRFCDRKNANRRELYEWNGAKIYSVFCLEVTVLQH